MSKDILNIKRPNRRKFLKFPEGEIEEVSVLDFENLPRQFKTELEKVYGHLAQKEQDDPFFAILEKKKVS